MSGYASASNDTNYGVHGATNSPNGYGVYYSGGLGGTGLLSTLVETQDYGWRHLYAMASPDVLFEDGVLTKSKPPHPPAKVEKANLGVADASAALMLAFSQAKPRRKRRGFARVPPAGRGANPGISGPRLAGSGDHRIGESQTPLLVVAATPRPAPLCSRGDVGQRQTNAAPTPGNDYPGSLAGGLLATQPSLPPPCSRVILPGKWK